MTVDDSGRSVRFGVASNATSAIDSTRNLIAMLGLYIHIPFCAAICNYCNFNRGLFDAGSEGALRRCADRRDRQARRVRRAGRQPADTIYFGGGTPSLLEPAEVARDHRARAGERSTSPPTPRSRSRPTRKPSPSSRLAGFRAPASTASVSASSRFATTSCGGCRGCTAPTARARRLRRGARAPASTTSAST